MEEAKDELYAIMRQIRRLKPSDENDFAINQTKAFETQYNSLKLAIGGTGIFITVLCCGWRHRDHEYHDGICNRTYP